MKEVTVTWLARMSLDARMDGHHVLMDARGAEGDDRGPTPVDLLLAAVAGCTAMDVVSILRKKRQPFTGLVVRASGERAEGHPYRFTHITLTYEVHGSGVDLAAVERAVELSDEKYCSVSATLREQTRVTTRVVLVAEGAAGAGV